MNQLCRHILPAGRPCTQPAVRSTLYCRHHQVIKRALAQVEPKPDPYGIYELQSAVIVQEKMELSSRPKRSEVLFPNPPQLREAKNLRFSFLMSS
jgi:hypothetical protein